MPVVFVRIRRLRQGGRLIPDHEAMWPVHQLAGDLSATAARFELRRFMSASGEPAAVLYDAKVLSILAGVIRIRGYEEYRGAAVLQEWECTQVPMVIGPDGLTRWDVPELQGRALGG